MTRPHWRRSRRRQNVWAATFYASVDETLGFSGILSDFRFDDALVFLDGGNDVISSK